MKCLIFFGMSSMKEGTSAQLSGRGELHGGARVTTLVTLRKCTLGNKRKIKTVKFVSASTKGFKGGLAWTKPSKKDMAVTFCYWSSRHLCDIHSARDFNFAITASGTAVHRHGGSLTVTMSRGAGNAWPLCQHACACGSNS